jgi:thioredoxin
MVRVGRWLLLLAVVQVPASCARLLYPLGGEPYDARANARAEIDAALGRARADGKLVLLAFGANWCPACHALQSLIEQRPVASFLETHFHVVYVDVGRFNRNRDIDREYGFATWEGIPAAVVLSADGDVLGIERGGRVVQPSADAMVHWLSAWLAPRPAVAPGPPAEIDSAQVHDALDTLAVRVAGEPSGTFICGLAVGADAAVSTVVSVYHDSIAQHVTTIHDLASLRPREVWDSTANEQVHLTYAGGRVRGIRVTPRSTAGGASDTVTVDLPADSSTIDRRNLLIIVPRLALPPGSIHTLRVFDSWSLRSYPVRLAVGERAWIDLPAGRVEAYRVDLTGDLWVLPQTWYVSVDPPRRILRILWPRDAILEPAS